MKKKKMKMKIDFNERQFDVLEIAITRYNALFFDEEPAQLLSDAKINFWRHELAFQIANYVANEYESLEKRANDDTIRKNAAIRNKTMPSISGGNL